MKRPLGLVVAIDGPSGAGKSTAAKALAKKLGYTFIDTGAMYRALALKALRTGISLDAPGDLAGLARVTRIDLIDGGRGVALDGQVVTSEIRTQDVGAAASRIAAHPAVRKVMVARQQDLGREGGVVLDGRDIGTAVFPDAEVKFYVDADPARRAVRRHGELQKLGVTSDVGQIERQIRERDAQDMTRDDSPLTRTRDAEYLDTTDLSPEDAVQKILHVVERRLLDLGGSS